MRISTTAVAVLLASVWMTACAKKEEAPAAEVAPAATMAPAETAPAATPDPAANTEDGSQTSGDKVSPKTNETPPPAN
jgi:hypothetical protein